MKSAFLAGRRDGTAAWRLGGVLLLALVAVLPVLTLMAQEQVSGNLLVDGDFEAPPTWPMQDGIGEVQVAPGWRAYYLDRPPAYVELPANCEKLREADCYWMRPEFRDNTSFANRIRSGERSQKYFSYGRMHEAGLMQQVSGLPPGARVRFSIWMQAWMCYNPSECGKDGVRSDQPSEMHLRVGIDPLGGTDPFTETVVWAPEQPAWDKFVLFVVETTAISDTVTVMTHSRAEWPWARNNNDVYLDDASLVIVGAYSTTAVIPLTLTAAPTLDTAQLTTTRTVTGTPTLTPTATATATPLPAGAITYSVGMGDTLFSIALRHGLQVTDLLGLNGFMTSTELLLGQPLVVQVVPLTPTPTALPATVVPTPSVTPRPSPTLTPTPAPTPTDTPAPAQAVRVRELPAAALALIATGVCAAAVGLGMRLMRPKRRKRAAP